MATQMEQDGTWGSEVEVMALTHLLDILIYCYDTSHEWHLFTPGNIRDMFNQNQFATHQMAMYVRHYVNHYDVVRSVQWVLRPCSYWPFELLLPSIYECNDYRNSGHRMQKKKKMSSNQTKNKSVNGSGSK